MEIRRPIVPAYVLQSAVICLRCGYNLRGLSTDGQCPECGAACEISIYGDALRCCSPQWVRRLARGAFHITIGLVCAGATMLVLVFPLIGVRDMPYELRSVLAFATLAVGGVGFIFGVVGLMQITASAPVTIRRERLLSARRLVRITVALVVAGVLGVFAQRFFSAPRSSGVAVLAWAIGFGCAIVGSVAYLRHVLALAERMPRSDVRDQAEFLQTGIYVALAVLLCIALPLAVAVTSDTGAACCAAALISIWVLVGGVITLSMQFQLTRQLGEAARQATELTGREERIGAHSRGDDHVDHAAGAPERDA